MRLVLESETRIRWEPAGDGFTILPEGASISPFHLLAASLASCTALTVKSWAAGANLDSRSLVVSVGWTIADERPNRVDHMDLEISWPELPQGRLKAAERAAALCPIHATLAPASPERGLAIALRVVGGG